MHVASHDTRRPSTRYADYLAAGSIAGAGYLHYCLYNKGYRAIPTIGTGFLVQFVGSAVVAGALILPLELRTRIGPVPVTTRVVSRLAGIALAVGTLVAFALSRRPGGLFDFQERGLQPAPQSLLTILTEGVAVVLLVAAFVVDDVRRPVATLEVPVQPAARRPRASV